MSTVELTLSAARPSPAEALAELATQCAELGPCTWDVYGDAALGADVSSLRRFETEVAACLGMPEGVFMCSGVMAQDIALSLYGRIDQTSEARKSFVVHYSSHILLHEQSAYSSLLHLNATIIPKDETKQNQDPVSYEIIAPLLDSPEPPMCVVLECPFREIGGKLTSWEDLQAISAHCRRRGIPLHMDGARLWEAQGGYGKPFGEICALFDSVYVSFYKGLGGLTGAMLLGSSDFIAQAKVWQRRFGGVVYTQLPYYVSCWAGFRAHKDEFQTRLRRLQEAVALITDAASAEAARAGDSSALVRFDPPQPHVSMVHMYLRCSADVAIAARNAAIEECGVSCFMRIRGSSPNVAGHQECYTEFNMGPLNGALGNEVWGSGWECFLKHLRSAMSD